MYKAWVLKIEKQYRLRLPEEIVTQIPWLKEGTNLSATAFLGTEKQLQLAPVCLEDELHQQLETALKKAPPTESESTAEWVHFARYAAATWKVRFLTEPGRKRVSLVIPRELRDLDLCPPDGSAIVLFVMGAIVELWKVEPWTNYLRQIRVRLDEISPLVQDEISSR